MQLAETQPPEIRLWFQAVRKFRNPTELQDVFFWVGFWEHQIRKAVLSAGSWLKSRGVSSFSPRHAMTRPSKQSEPCELSELSPELSPELAEWLHKSSASEEHIAALELQERSASCAGESVSQRCPEDWDDDWTGGAFSSERSSTHWRHVYDVYVRFENDLYPSNWTVMFDMTLEPVSGRERADPDHRPDLCNFG